jgi:hypothetical protein
MLPIGPCAEGSYTAPARKWADHTAANVVGDGAAGTSCVMARNASPPVGSWRTASAVPPGRGVALLISKLETTMVHCASGKSPSVKATGGAAAAEAVRATARPSASAGRRMGFP